MAGAGIFTGSASRILEASAGARKPRVSGVEGRDTRLPAEAEVHRAPASFTMNLAQAYRPSDASRPPPPQFAAYFCVRCHGDDGER